MTDKPTALVPPPRPSQDEEQRLAEERRAQELADRQRAWEKTMAQVTGRASA